MKRLFIAIKIKPEEPFIMMFNHIQKFLYNEKISWTDINNTHLTLKFLGDTDEKKIPQLKNIVDDINNSLNPFELILSSVKLFGSSYKPNIIWVEIEKNKYLDSIYSNLITKLKTLNINADRQNFVPHITLGRISKLKDKTLLNKIVNLYSDTFFQSSQVTEIILYESILQQHHPPIYIEL
ncbi:MAG: RNA 2',3'-cyclic phosphodiesterase [Bacteroidales bacterium]|jgi:RNA 2',3'-cyclic 3'-phosphodiesterase|nr:RNA 2',3'-cyclic phosphodiesterase [Bacteroidales bacterium]MDD3915167.1 RNA 2',3'-cyclic phosphodiesterase [Bacteroidales bacterium]MDD4634923.1 RNA 2',3'-cyclic phosphodiesterase [Bacteroidales bacterium]